MHLLVYIHVDCCFNQVHKRLEEFLAAGEPGSLLLRITCGNPDEHHELIVCYSAKEGDPGYPVLSFCDRVSVPPVADDDFPFIARLRVAQSALPMDAGGGGFSSIELLSSHKLAVCICRLQLAVGGVDAVLRLDRLQHSIGETLAEFAVSGMDVLAPDLLAEELPAAAPKMAADDAELWDSFGFSSRKRRKSKRATSRQQRNKGKGDDHANAMDRLGVGSLLSLLKPRAAKAQPVEDEWLQDLPRARGRGRAHGRGRGGRGRGGSSR